MTVRVRAALIDLDGTLLDTAADIAAAANRMLERVHRAPRSVEEIRGFVGQGSARLVSRCLEAAGTQQDAFDESLAAFVRFYDEESGRRTLAYPGVHEGLKQLAAAGIALACVTNKLQRFTVPLLERTGLAPFFGALVCGDTVSRLKPDPLPYVHACSLLAVVPGQAVVIGDSANDAVAGRAAGCRVLCVPYGYSEGRPVESIDCDAIVDDLASAAAYIRAENERAREAQT